MTGALNFTLGLQANQFLNSLGVASGKLVGFLGVANGIQMAFHKMWAAIEQGGQLKDLAAAASLSVKDLYRLQRAFKEVGASADSVPAVMNRLRRTLGSGQQDGLLASIGLDPKALGSMNPAAQFEAVARALAKLNVNARSQAAQQIFGREGAMTIQQIANSGNEFSEAMQAASADAGIWQKVANAFDSIADKIAAIQDHIKTLWALLAGALIQAFNEGKLAEVITDIIVTGFQAALAVIPGLFAKLGEVLLRAFQVPLAYLQAGMEYAIDQAVNNPKLRLFMKITSYGSSELMMKALGIGQGGPASSFEEIFRNRMAEGVKFNLGSGEFGMGDISNAANGALGSGFASAKELFAGLGGRLGELVGRLPQAQIAAFAGGAGGGIGGANKTSEATSIEKMGGVLLGLGRGFGGDEARQTANNTRRTNQLLEKTNQLLASGSGAAFTNL